MNMHAQFTLKMKFAVLALVAAFASAELQTAQVADLSELFDYVNSVDVADNGKFDCNDMTKREQCAPSPQCNWCKALPGAKEKGGCKDPATAKHLQQSGRFFCNVDPLAHLCNGLNQEDCSNSSDCNWCQHPTISKGCYAKKQALLLHNTKFICHPPNKGATGVAAQLAIDEAQEE